MIIYYKHSTHVVISVLQPVTPENAQTPKTVKQKSS